MRQVSILTAATWGELETRLNHELKELNRRVLDIKLGWNSERPIAMIIYGEPTP